MTERMEKRMEKLDEKMDKIIQKLEIMDKKMDELLLIDKNIGNNCDKMAEHIDFVNEVYENVKTPLHYISNKINSMLITNGEQYIE
jgi:hypothetical protein